MRFPKAHYGIKMLFISEILSLVVVVIDSVLTGVISLPDTGDTAGAAVKGGILLGVFLIVLPAAIISLVLHFVGLSNAKADEPRFRTALILQIVNLVLLFVLGCIMMVFVFSSVLKSVGGGSIPVMPSFFPVYIFLVGLIGTGFSMCVMLCIASGISNLARKLGDEPVETYSRRFQGVIVAFSIISLVIRALSSFAFGANPDITINWPTLINMLLTIALQLITVVYVARAKRMLAQ